MSNIIDLTPENLTTIQSLVAREQGRLVRSGQLNKGPAYYKACQEVGKAINPQIDGPELAAWIGKRAGVHAKDKRDFGTGRPPIAKQEPKCPRHPEQITFEVKNIPDRIKDSVTFEIIKGLTPPEKRLGRKPAWADAYKLVEDMPIGEWVAIKLQSSVLVERAQSTLSTYSKRYIKSKAQGWMLSTQKDQRDTCVLWLIKQNVN
ncbi:MAG: hypothetical protein IPO08_20250 [Xanthomonadales bacterium]|nr:hypothetical protein [Xanthomonadales bacterium]